MVLQCAPILRDSLRAERIAMKEQRLYSTHIQLFSLAQVCVYIVVGMVRDAVLGCGNPLCLWKPKSCLLQPWGDKPLPNWLTEFKSSDVPLAFSLFKITVIAVWLFFHLICDQTIENDQSTLSKEYDWYKQERYIDIHSAVLNWESTCVFVSRH